MEKKFNCVENAFTYNLHKTIKHMSLNLFRIYVVKNMKDKKAILKLA